MSGGNVAIAYYNNGFFEVDPETQTMVEFPVMPMDGMYVYIPYDWEIIKPFLDHYSLTPIWIDFWGRGEETVTWPDVADWALPNFGCFYGHQSKEALCHHAVSFEPHYWWTRYPQETTKFWNLTNLFHPEAWMWTFLTFILITVTLKFASVLGSKIGLNVGSEEVALIPFRWQLKLSTLVKILLTYFIE